MSDIRIDAFWRASQALMTAADRMAGQWSGTLVSDMRNIAREAEREYHQLSQIMPDVRAYQRQKAEAYDAYVTRIPEDDGCSCHINPPCGFCTSQSEEEA